ncbi:hypothetical protein BB934_45440 (plasmid) [Microvirga ossetica]|uniref:Uncharacterized protein n=1 Tax=Microvirga ossetica TaxID=1882682 RepID=A0A1B2EZS6_9HYPH|nr:hypothetical protein [Microvirga ossetica]ANY85466.1 hypothetical protein BB934_45440 [Microvirga ossetica]
MTDTIETEATKAKIEAAYRLGKIEARNNEINRLGTIFLGFGVLFQNVSAIELAPYELLPRMVDEFFSWSYWFALIPAMIVRTICTKAIDSFTTRKPKASVAASA